MTDHVHGSGCINTYPDCEYPDTPELTVCDPACMACRAGHASLSPISGGSRSMTPHFHDGERHVHPAAPGDDHAHPEDIPSPGNEPAVYGCTTGCGNETPRPGQPCDPCDTELGVG